MTYCDKSILSPDCERPECKACGLHREPDKKDVWEEDLWVNVMEDYVITAELGHVAKDEKAHKDEMRRHFARLTEYIRQNFISRTAVEKIIRELKEDVLESVKYEYFNKYTAKGAYELALDDLKKKI